MISTYPLSIQLVLDKAYSLLVDCEFRDPAPESSGYSGPKRWMNSAAADVWKCWRQVVGQ